MKRHLTYLLIPFFLMSSISVSFSQQKQNETLVNFLNGKKFYALLNESCAETSGGDFMMVDHCLLVFIKNTIIIKQYENRDRTYKFKEEPQKAEVKTFVIKNDEISITGYTNLRLNIDTSNIQMGQLSIYTHYGLVTPSKKRIYFTELKKGTLTHFANSLN